MPCDPGRTEDVPMTRIWRMKAWTEQTRDPRGTRWQWSLQVSFRLWLVPFFRSALFLQVPKGRGGICFCATCKDPEGSSSSAGAAFKCSRSDLVQRSPQPTPHADTAPQDTGRPGGEPGSPVSVRSGVGRSSGLALPSKAPGLWPLSAVKGHLFPLSRCPLCGSPGRRIRGDNCGHERGR